MKILIFADLHGHNFKEFSYINEEGINSRLMEQAKVIDRVHRTAHDEKVDSVWFLGDLTHLKNNIDSQVIQVVSYEIRQIAENFPVYLLPGNHDYRMWGKEPALLEVFEDLHSNFTVLTHGIVPLGDRTVFTFPYSRKLIELDDWLENRIEVKKGDLFFGHQDIVGVYYGGYQVQRGLDADVLSKKFALSLIGHCHDKLEVRPNVISLGAPMQHNFSDIGKQRGWWILDVDSLKLDFIENKDSPKFFDLHFDTNTAQEPLNPEEDYHRVTIDGTAIPDAVKALRWKRINLITKNEKKGRGEFRLSDSMDKILREYIKLKNKDLGEDRLFEIGKGYLL